MLRAAGHVSRGLLRDPEEERARMMAPGRRLSFLDFPALSGLARPGQVCKVGGAFRQRGTFRIYGLASGGKHTKDRAKLKMILGVAW